MTLARRDFLALGAVAGGAAIAGGIAGALVLRSRDAQPAFLAVEFRDLSGRPRRLAEWGSAPLLCNFWAPWCAPCREEMPLLDAVQQRHAAGGLKVVGIAVDSSANVREFARKFPPAYQWLVAGAKALDLLPVLGNPAAGLPFTLAMRPGGRLLERKLGAFSASELEATVRRLLG